MNVFAWIAIVVVGLVGLTWIVLALYLLTQKLLIPLVRFVLGRTRKVELARLQGAADRVLHHWKFWVIFVAAVVFAFCIWPTPYSYHFYARGYRLYRINRTTGRVDYLHKDGWLKWGTEKPKD